MEKVGACTLSNQMTECKTYSYGLTPPPFFPRAIRLTLKKEGRTDVCLSLQHHVAEGSVGLKEPHAPPTAEELNIILLTVHYLTLLTPVQVI